MRELKHAGGKSYFATICCLGVFVLVSTLVAPAVIAQGSQNFSSNQPANPKPQKLALILNSVLVNGRALTDFSNESLRLPANPGTVSFSCGPNPRASNAPLRFRCQLDGFEQAWHERSDVMRLLIRFIDVNQRDIGEQVFTVSGESPGWTGSFKDSPWVARKEVVIVPPGAVHFWMVISSAGPPEAVGFFAVRKLVVWPSEGDTNCIRMIPPMKLNATKIDLEDKQVTPAGWERNGIRPTDSLILPYGSDSEVALAILDDDPHGHADWNTFRGQGLELKPGETLTFEWEEVHSIGLTDFGRTDYTNLPPGLYRFRMEPLNIMGIPKGDNVSLLVTVPVAFWKTVWFWVATVVALFGLAIGGWRLVESQQMKRQVRQLERQRVLEQERFRIAQDIHDDLGARVAQISLLSSAAQERETLTVAEARTELGTVSRMSRELVAALYETVWAVSPENDHLDSLVSYVCQVANQMCGVANLKCRFEMPETPPKMFLAGPIRHNVIMAVKEAIHNVIKHGHASEIQISIRHANGVVNIEVSDNGCGFDPAVNPRGNGLDNMARRFRSLRGHCLVESRPGAGTKVTFEFPLPTS